MTEHKRDVQDKTTTGEKDAAVNADPVERLVMFAVVSISCGDIFERENGDIMMKLSNPAKPALANLYEWPVWAADIGNGHIEKIEPREPVKLIGGAYDLINTKRPDDLAMIIRRFVHKCRKANIEAEFCGLAMDYLQRVGLQSSPLRKT